LSLVTCKVLQLPPQCSKKRLGQRIVHEQWDHRMWCDSMLNVRRHRPFANLTCQAGLASATFTENQQACRTATEDRSKLRWLQLGNDGSIPGDGKGNVYRSLSNGRLLSEPLAGTGDTRGDLSIGAAILYDEKRLLFARTFDCPANRRVAFSWAARTARSSTAYQQYSTGVVRCARRYSANHLSV
jgi:hypothetical protein